jgi:uncharacterized MAPEG superfamily protein
LFVLLLTILSPSLCSGNEKEREGMKANKKKRQGEKKRRS